MTDNRPSGPRSTKVPLLSDVSPFGQVDEPNPVITRKQIPNVVPVGDYQ
jgi:hypothetical protein